MEITQTSGACVLGLDIGTTTVSAAVIDVEQGHVLETLTRPNDAKLSAADGCSEYDARKILQKVLDIADGLLARYPAVKSIGLTGQMHGIVYTDADGRAVSPLYTWQDSRANRSFDGCSTYCDEILRRTGHRVSTGYGFATLFYNHCNGLEPTEARSFCTVMDLAAMTLTGRAHPCIHASNAASLGLYDVNNNCFDCDAVQKLGLSHLQLPTVWKDEPVGTYRGIPVGVAIGDNQASFYGSVREEESTALVNFGTGSQISVVCERPLSVWEESELRPYLFGKYLLCGSALCGGRAYSMLEKFFFSYASALSSDAVPQYEIMNALALEHYEQRRDLKVSTQFCGTRRDPSQRGSVERIGEDNFTPANLILGVLQGMTDELKHYFDSMDTHGVTQLAASGNAVQRNPVLQRMLRDTFGADVFLTDANEEAALGAAMYAGVCSGVLDDEQRKRLICYKEVL
ncbi:MAG: hypothetical protein IJC25_02080 [Clostridia bacterium]|nr:hypothetical protein [Clostridia bacterium]